MTPLPDLTPAEKRIFAEFMRHGDSNKELAWSLGMSENAIKAHMKAIMRKFSRQNHAVHNRTQLAMWGVRNGYGVTVTA